MIVLELNDLGKVYLFDFLEVFFCKTWILYLDSIGYASYDVCEHIVLEEANIRI